MRLARPKSISEETIWSEDHIKMFARNETTIIHPPAEAESQDFGMGRSTAISRRRARDDERSYFLWPHTKRSVPGSERSANCRRA
jgi:hypothetical protein